MLERSLMRRPTATLFPRTATDPFNMMERFFDEEFFRPFFGRWNEPMATEAWHPAVDIRETNDAFEVTAELPGMTKKDVEVTVENNVLTIQGERRFDETVNRNDFRRVERAYGSFLRSFTLPRGVDADHVNANFNNGLLHITVPKTEQSKPKKIAVS